MKLDYDLLAREYAQHRQVHPEVLKDLLQTGALNRSSQVLDVGCGTGNYTSALEKAAGCSCWGVEPSEQMLAKARECSHSARFLPLQRSACFPTRYRDGCSGFPEPAHQQ